ncbi:MAG: chain length determinant protein EpsF [Burkholderiales bacterium]|nr:chain length determinant protein EpsF [Burkholderiales bacterium]
MTFGQFLGILRARWWIAVGTLFLTVGATIAVSLVLPKQYTATTTLVVDYKGTDPILGVMLPAQMMPGYMATQVDIIQSTKVATEVVKALGFAQSPVVRQQWMDDTEGKGTIEDYFATILLKKLDVKPSRESSVIEISFSGSDPRFAAAVANSFAEQYRKTNLELRVEPARQNALWFDERLQQLRKGLEEAQARLAEYQRDKGFTAADERLDLENARLSELNGQYTSTQGQAADAQSRLRQLNEFVARGASPETLPDVLANPLIQNLKALLNQTEGRLEQTASQLGANHPEVKRLQADIESQKTKLKSEINSAASSIRNAANIAQRREADLRDQLAAQKAKLLRANQGRDQFMVLLKEVDNAQKAFDIASQRFQATSLESQASQTNISVLTSATPPIEPSSPKLILNTILSVFLGGALGVGFALLVELLNRRVRSAREFAEALNAPVLGLMLNDKATQKRSRRYGRVGQRKLPAPIQPAAHSG